MAAITVAMITDLRNRTNAGMMDCKRALTQTEGNMEEAIKILREKGLAIQVKRADKESKQGSVAAASAADGKTIALVEVNSETDFVANTDNFKNFVKLVADTVLAKGEDIGDSVKEEHMTICAQTGENVKISRAARYVQSGTGKIGSYIHMGGKIGVLVEVACGKEETVAREDFNQLVHDISLQIAGLSPRFLQSSEVPQADVDAEIEIKLNAMKEQKGKLPPENALEGIKKGMAQKFFSEICLIDQLFVKNGPGEKTTVKQLVAKVAKDAGDTIEIKRFVRFQLGAA